MPLQPARADTIYVKDPPSGDSSGPLKASWHQVWHGDDGGNTTRWEDDGLLALQWGLDRGLAESLKPGCKETMIQHGGRALFTQRLPTAPFKSNYNPDPAASSAK